MKKGNNVMYDKLLRALAKAINDAVEYKMKTAEFDRSYQGRVAEILGGGYKCSIVINGREHTARYYRDNLKVGDVVWVCAPRNNWNQLYVI